ncbi:MAG: helix-turn-helix transcriptional regulator [Deltaproteobacteria bacterium]|nr:helix-turn-helix transcriptional regulator [Deltaproteobacteria bacterium]
MNALEIRIELLKKGTSMRAVAKKIGVSANAVYLVAHRKLVSLRIMAALADTLDLKLREVFPEYEPKPRWRANAH